MSSPQLRGLLFLNYSPPLQLNLSLERIGAHLRKTSVPPVDRGLERGAFPAGWGSWSLRAGDFQQVFCCDHDRVTVFFWETSFSVTVSQNVLQRTLTSQKENFGQ